ncbi:hypothetical protein L596_022189 [Steinernema carpocapsae]|uniref:Bifunctional lysine-specific demethylase and histidyl-hydroxylase n=1 Tax=Steinernema carpocapsae TaxID=34508 RepID=A0A4U5MKY8_STECR|nr:hypothetical protein L596_022189 [Steinernema carpocapsae]
MGRNRNKFKKEAKDVLGVQGAETAADSRRKQLENEEKLRKMYDNLNSLTSAVSVAKQEGKLKEKAYHFKDKKKKTNADKTQKRREVNFSVAGGNVSENVPEKLSKSQKKKQKKAAKKAAQVDAKNAEKLKKAKQPKNGVAEISSIEKKTKKLKKNGLTKQEKADRKRRSKHPSPDPARIVHLYDEDEDIQTIEPTTRFNGEIMKKGVDYSVVDEYDFNMGSDGFDEEAEDAVWSDVEDEDEDVVWSGEELGEDEFIQDIFVADEDEAEDGEGAYDYLENVDDEEDFDSDSEGEMDYDELYSNIIADGKDMSLLSQLPDDSDLSEDSSSDLDSIADDEDEEAPQLVTKIVKATKTDPIDFSTFPFSKSKHSVQNASAAFNWMIGPCDVQTFFKSIFEKKVLNVKRNNKTFYGNLFSTATLTELLEKHCLEYGSNINIASYKNGVRTTLNGEGRVYPQAVKSHLQEKCSVQFVNPPTFDDNVWYICEVLQELFGSFVGANTYLTPANSAGFAPHWDEIDAFILQLEGSKRWKVYAPEGKEDSLPRESSGNFTDEDMKHRKPVFDDVIREGDLLYVPRGFIHQALTTKEHSLHITISVCRRNAFADMMDKLVPEVLNQLAEKSATLRRSLPCNFLDMGGIADCDYPSDESYNEKLMMPFGLHVHNLMKLSKNFLDNGVDMMAREFMKTALPPKLTMDEMKLSVLGHKTKLLSQKPAFSWTRDTKIRFIRKHAQRLIFESADNAFIAHRMNNSRLYEGKPEQVIDISPEMITGFTNLVSTYPEYLKVGDLECEAHGFDIALAQLLYSHCLVLVEGSN